MTLLEKLKLLVNDVRWTFLCKSWTWIWMTPFSPSTVFLMFSSGWSLITRGSLIKEYQPGKKRAPELFYPRLTIFWNLCNQKTPLWHLKISILQSDKTWMLFSKFTSRKLLYSSNSEECGVDCGKVQNIFLKVSLLFN